MKQRRFKLLTKVVFFYLLITLASFVISAIILQKEANKHMNNILENRFGHREHYIEKVLRRDPGKVSRIHLTTVEEVDRIPEGFTPVYRDTFIMNEQSQQEEVYRKKIDYISVEGKHYRIEMSKEADELYRFKDDVLHIILPIFGVLVIVIVLTNYLLSELLLEPFRRILKQMSLYKIGTAKSLSPINTTTKEFYQLKELYSKMQSRIEDDYFQLKEYTENMSHELQTPLAIIQNKIESLLSANNLTEKQAKKIKEIDDEIQQLSKLGSALNLITKIENNEFQDIQTVYTEPVIQNQINKIEEIAEMKQLAIEQSLNENHKFSIDKGLFDMLIRNLIKNALRYSSEGTTIKLYSDNEKLVISNQGDKLDFPKDEIFTRFKKGNGSHSIGLGLAIVKKICTVSQLQIDYYFENGVHRFEIYHDKA